MHGIGGLTDANDDAAGADLEPLAAAHQFRSIFVGAEDLGEPASEVGDLLRAVLMNQ